MRPYRLASLSLLLLLTACLPQTPVPPPPDPAALQAQRLTLLEQRLLALRGASVSRDGALSVSYPGEALFAQGAALPLPGGREVLDPLSDLLLALPEGGWQGTVRASGGDSAAYDLELAQKRAELLARYFRQRGLPAGVPALRAEAAPGAPLELSVQLPEAPASPASSAGEKR